MVLNYYGDIIVAMGNSKGIVTSHKLGSIDAAKRQHYVDVGSSTIESIATDDNLVVSK